MSLKLAEKAKDKSEVADRVIQTEAFALRHFGEHINNSIAPLVEAGQKCLDSGDLAF